jgi:site-specific recombinase XerD
MENKISEHEVIHGDLIEAPFHNYIHRATSDNTRKAYQTDVRHFMAWGGLLPTTPDVVIRYLETHAETLNSRTLTRRLTALKNWHTYQGFTDPTSHPLVRKTLTGIKNVHGKPKDKAPAMTLATLITLCEHLQGRGGLVDLRNIALLQIGFFGAFRRSELVAIQFKDLTFVPEGVEIMIPRSKTDQAGEGQVCAIPCGNETICPVSVLQTWLEAAGIMQGPVFRQISKNGEISDTGISPGRVNIILKSIAQECNLPDAEFYSAHSLRRGFATQASKNGAPFGLIMQQGRWKHEGTVLGYIEEGKRFEGNAASSILNVRRNENSF